MQQSVVICAHNPRADYLRRALESLKAQTWPVDRWELLLVDNRSDQRLADAWDLSWHPQARHVREDEIGLTAARLRAISEAGGELLTFVDDDNVLAEDFLEQAVGIAARYPYLGVFGAGVLEPEFEAEPKVEVIPLLHLLALRSVNSAQWSNNPRDFSSVPWGAGLCVTRAVAKQYSHWVQHLGVNQVLGRRGQQLSCAEDDLFSWVAAQGGSSFGIFPELRLRHLISANRVDPGYLLRLIRTHAFSHGVLDYVLSGQKPKEAGFFSLAHMILHGVRNGRFSMQCRWQSARGEREAAKFIQGNRLHFLEAAPQRSVAAAVRSKPEVVPIN